MSLYFQSFSISGDCSLTNSGQIDFVFSGGTGGWSVQSIPPSLPLPTSAYTPTDYTQYTASNLPPGQYFVQISDSGTNKLVEPFIISSGTSVSIDAESTTCGLDNGSITASTVNILNQTTLSLYNSSDNLVSTATPAFGTSEGYFTNLSADTYYVIGDDGGGCTGQSASVVILPSTGFDYGAYVVDDSSCFPTEGQGKIIITGLTTPTSAYTINWVSDVGGQTGTTVTGLTQGLYTVEVINSIGCVNQQSFFVDLVPPPVIGSLIVTQPPSCFTSDGEVEVVVVGGTAPYFYVGSNGDTFVNFSTSQTFTNLPSGLFTVTVTDAALCSVSDSVLVNTPNGFGGVTIQTTNSICNNNDGEISINLGFATPGVYNYTLSGGSGSVQTANNGGTSQIFSNLSSDDYTITIDNGSGCVFTGTTSVNNVDKFTIGTTISGTTCGTNNGEVLIDLSSGTTGTVAVTPVLYNLEGPLPSTSNTTLGNGNFQNLEAGTYQLTVTDAQGCSQLDTIFIPPSSVVDFTLIGTDPFTGSDGQIETLITNGVPPFTLVWSGDVMGQTGTTITGLTSGDYQLTVTDSEGCFRTRNITLAGSVIVSSYQSYVVSTETFTNTNSTGKRGILQMYNEGFYDLTTGDTNCVITAATFTAQVTVGSETKDELFYTSTGLTDFPSDVLWGNTISSLLEQFVGIGIVTIDFTENRITITNDCDEIEKNCTLETYNLLNDEKIIVNLIINYNIACVSCT